MKPYPSAGESSLQLLKSIIYKWYSIPWVAFISIFALLLAIVGLVFSNLPVLIRLAIWICIIVYFITLDKIFFLMLSEFVRQEVKDASYDEIIIKVISYLIRVKDEGKNSVNDVELKSIPNEKFQNISRLKSKKFECILNLLKKEYLLP